MKKYLLFSLLFIFITIFFYGISKSQEETKIQLAVLDLKGTNISEGEAIVFTERLQHILRKTELYDIIERGRIKEILEEQQFQESGLCNTDECAVEIGQLLSVEQIVVGGVANIGNLYTIQIRIIDVATGKVLASELEDCHCPIDKVLTETLSLVVSKLIKIKITNYPNMSYIEDATFTMGISDEKLDEFILNNTQWEKEWFLDSTPEHTIQLTGFYLDKYEVTNAEYQLFILANPDWAVGGQLAKQYTDEDYLYKWNGTQYPAGKGNYPINYVSWYAANAYAEWIGKRLPTEAEFEYALRGGNNGQLYPWGDKKTPLSKIGNLCDESAKAMNPDWQFIEGYDDGYERLAPVGVFDDNKFGLYDISGNLVEWCNDWYYNNYYNDSPPKDPIGADKGAYKVARGGGWSHIPYSLLNGRRYPQDPYTCLGDVGFRCAADGIK